ncbi:MAG: DUF5103 domain-containing protein [Leeuwenhoekiella sp.]
MKPLYLFYFLLLPLITTAQEIEVAAPDYIKTVQFKGNTQLSQLPLIQLGQSLLLSFDDIIGDEADYYYTIEHYNADWTPSVLVKSEYMDGFDNVRIINYTNSVSTLQLYTHYELSIPNKNTRRLTKTGNYMLKILNTDDELIFSRKFMIYSSEATVGIDILRTRDLETIDKKQVVNFKIDSGDNILINPDQNVKPVIIQNNDLKNSIANLKPQYIIGNVLEYRYDTESSFYGGNEFLSFENKDVRAATNAIQYIELLKLYHNYLYINPTRADQPYTYNPDINGNFVITTLQGQNPDSEAEYVWIHFGLNHPQLPEDENIYIYGNFNDYVIEDALKMEFNQKSGIYEKAVLLKQGFYNYKYVVTKNGQLLPYDPISGDFWQTENEYDVIVYYREPGGRYDKIIGVGNALSTNISNVRRN